MQRRGGRRGFHLCLARGFRGLLVLGRGVLLLVVLQLGFLVLAGGIDLHALLAEGGE